VQRHILIVNVASHGLVYPTLPVVSELVRRGHRVTYATAGGFVEPVAAAGATPLPYRSEILHADPEEVFGGDDAGARPHLMYLRENLSVLRAVTGHFGDTPPDLVLYDDFPFLAGQLLAECWGRPAGRLSAAFASNEHYSFSADMVRRSGTVHPLQLPAFRGALAETLTRYGLTATPEEFWSRVADLTVAFIPRAFQIAAETFDGRFAFVGPCLGERAFLGRWSPPPTGLPVVLVSLGATFNDHPEFFRECVRAFAGQPWHAVVTLGDRVDPAELGTLPANVEVHRWVPHVSVLEHARVCVTHGGMGTVMESLYWGRPMVVVPRSFDVEPMARRIDELGLGALLRPAEVDATTLRAAVAAVAGDHEMVRRVRAMREEVRSAGGPVRAASEIESYLSRAGKGVVHDGQP
jgi:MGT family glycosyltransferase